MKLYMGEFFLFLFNSFTRHDSAFIYVIGRRETNGLQGASYQPKNCVCPLRDLNLHPSDKQVEF